MESCGPFLSVSTAGVGPGFRRNGEMFDPANFGTRTLAVNQARRYDKCTCAYPGFVASRRNYDVGQGTDANGEWRSGVFEASWRPAVRARPNSLRPLLFAGIPRSESLMCRS